MERHFISSVSWRVDNIVSDVIVNAVVMVITIGSMAASQALA